MERGSRFEGTHIELKKSYDAIERLLGQLVEKGGDMSSSAKASLRTQIQSQLQLLGLKSIEDWMGLGIYLEEVKRNIPTPDDYPTKDEFEKRVRELAQGTVPVVYDTDGADLIASSVATFGETNWAGVQPRRGSLVNYLYELGKVMCSEFHYQTIFPETDAIKVTNRWEIDLGRHRSFALRVLGETYVKSKGLDQWVTVRRTE